MNTEVSVCSEGNTHQILCLCKAQSTEKSLILQVIWCGSTGEFSRTHHNKNPSRDQEDDGKEKYLSIKISRKDHICEDVHDIEWWTKQSQSKCAQSAVEVASHTREVAHGCWSDQEMKKLGTDPTTTSQR